jgi:hypothetical protein
LNDWLETNDPLIQQLDDIFPSNLFPEEHNLWRGDVLDRTTYGRNDTDLVIFSNGVFNRLSKDLKINGRIRVLHQSLQQDKTTFLRIVQTFDIHARLIQQHSEAGLVLAMWVYHYKEAWIAKAQVGDTGNTILKYLGLDKEIYDLLHLIAVVPF